jgi:hypothetical protein
VQILSYAAQYELNKDIRISVNGLLDKDSISSGVANTFHFATQPVRLSLGHRSLNDTNFYFGNVGVNYTYKGFSLFGDLQQTQRYSQKRDETYVKVDEGEGDYVYDPITDTYIEKEGGDYVRRIFLLPDFSRVITRNFGVEVAYNRDLYDASGRFYYIDEENFRSHNEDIILHAALIPYEVSLQLRQDIRDDSRYILATNSRYERTVILSPSIHTLASRFEFQTTTDLIGEIEKEHRDTYRGEISYDIIERPVVRPKIGYTYSIMRSQYFTDLNIRQNAPKSGILIGFPLRSLRGKIETTAEFVYRLYNIDDIPFFFAANEPEGLSTILSALMTFGVGANTVFNLIYRVQFRPNETPDHNLRLQSRIRF